MIALKKAAAEISALEDALGRANQEAAAAFADKLIAEHYDKFPGGAFEIQNFAQCVLDELNSKKDQP